MKRKTGKCKIFPEMTYNAVKRLETRSYYRGFTTTEEFLHIFNTFPYFIFFQNKKCSDTMFVKGNTIFRYWFNVNTLFMNVYGSVRSTSIV